MKFIKQFGMPRSGTNLVKGLLEVNYRVRVLNLVLGSKHLPFSYEAALEWQPPSDSRSLLDISDADLLGIKDLLKRKRLPATLVIKNPYAWLWSVYRFRSAKTDRQIDFDRRYIEKTLPDWISTNEQWLSDLPRYFPEQLIVYRYEDLVPDASRILRRHGALFGLKQIADPIIGALSNATRAAADRDRGRQVEGDKPFDLNSHALNSYRLAYQPAMKEVADQLLKECSPALKTFIDW